MFTLSALKAKAEESISSTNSTRRPEENSGLIDLRALMAEAEQAEAEAHADSLKVSAHLDVYPFGSPTPLPMVITPVDDDEVARPLSGRASSKRARAWLGGAAALLAVLGMGVAATAAVQARNALDELRTAQAAVDADTIRRAITSRAAAPSTLAEPSPAAAVSPSVGDNTPQSGITSPREPNVAPHITKAPVLTRTSEPTGVAAAPQAQPKPAPRADNCNGDLMCAMQRAVQNKKK